MIRCVRCGLRHALAACPSCGERGPDAPRPLAPLPSVPGFALEGLLGAGGFAQVLAARDAAGRALALKLAAAPSGEAALQLEREAAALRALEGAAVPHLYGSGRLTDGTPWLALERLPGPSLAEALAAAAGPVPAPGPLGLALCEALATVHSRGWVHGDVKPENALGGPGRVRLLDLGLAAPAARDPGGRADGWAGTVEYLAPELLPGGAPTCASDVYAAGAVLLELFTGRPPFTGSDAEIRLGHRERRARWPAGSFAPDGVQALVLRCLEKDPAARPADGGALAAALAAALALAPGAPPREELAVRAPEAPAPSRRRAVAAVLGEGGADVIALSDALGRSGGTLARSGEGRFAAVLDAPADTNPLRAALRCAEALVAAGVARRVCVALVEATPLRASGGGTRWIGPELARDERYPAPGDPEGVLCGAEVVEAVPEAAFAPAPGAAGRFRLLPSAEPGTSALTAVRLDEAPLAGRGPLLDRALALAARARGGAPGVAVVLGEPGHGKSRLASALAARLAREGGFDVLGLRARGPGADGGRGALGELLRWSLGIAAPSAATAAPGELELLARSLPAGVGEGWPAIALALGLLPPSAPEVRRLAAAPGALRTYQARTIAEALRARAAARPVAVVLDDAHLAEEALLDGLELAALAEAGGRVLVCAVGDPAFAAARPGFGRRAAAWAEERIGPLEGEAALELCLALLRPAEHVPARALEALVERSGGVPLVLSELTRALRRRGILRQGPGGGWVLAADEMERELATPLTEWLAERELAALPGDVAAHAQLLALLGEDAHLDEIAGVLAEIEREGLGAAFPLDARVATARLVELGLLVRRGSGVAFRTPLARECVARSAAPARVALVHRAAYRHHARAGGVGEERRLLRLARHAAGCGEREVASAVTADLADDRAARQDYLGAEALYSRTLELAPEGAVDRRLRALRGRGLMRTHLGRQREGALDLDAAAELADGPRGAATRAACLLEAAIAVDWVNDYAGAAARVARAEEAAAAGANGAALAAHLALARGRVAYRAGRWEEAAARLEAAARAGEALGDDGYETVVIALVLLGWCLPNLGRAAEAEAAATRAISLAGGRGDLLHVASALNSRQQIRASGGDLAGALQDLEAYRRLGRELGMASAEHVAAHNAGEHLYLAGDLAGAATWAERAEEVERLHPDVTTFPFAALLLARIHLRAGRLAEAAGKLAPARRLLAGHPGVAGPGVEVLAGAVALAAEGAGPAAWDDLAARAARDSVGQEVVEVLELRALAAARAGRRAEAREALAEARRAAARVGGVMGARLDAAAAEIG
ncbi:MAG: serine/threonine-protein kinase [Anaeromyxobacter sp.]